MKSFLLTVFGFLLLAPKGFAILDANNNGLSDFWEKPQNNGELFSETFSPQADPDSDGWTNAQEASAGTSPFDPNPPDGLIRPEIAHIPAVLGEPDENGVPMVITPEAVTVAWPTLVGKQYALQLSHDLSEGSWIPIGEPFISNGNEVTYGVEVNDSDKRFWRVSVSDVDTDSDGLSNHEEFLAGTNPAMADADGDGWTDSQELIAGTDPRNQDSDGDGIPDPIDTQLLVSALAFPDADGDGIADSDDAAPNGPRGSAPMIVSETASGNPVSNLVKDETVRFMVSVTNPSGPAPTASNLTFFLNGTEETANITAVGSPGASSQSFLLTWTAKTTTDYPTRTLQHLTLRFRDAQMATTWLKLACIDVAEWEGMIAISPIRYALADEEGIGLLVESHINGKRHKDHFGGPWSARALFYRGPIDIPLINENSHSVADTFKIPSEIKFPLFIARFTGSTVSKVFTIEAGDYAAFPHNAALIYNNLTSKIRYDWSEVVTEVDASSSKFQDYGTTWSEAPISIHWLRQGQWRPVAETAWSHASPFTAYVERAVHSAYHETPTKPLVAGFWVFSKLPASIIPHLAGTVEVPGLPLHPLAIEKEGILFPVASETYHQILYKVDPAAEVWAAGIKLHLGQTSGQNTTPQTGIGLYDFTSGDPEPVSLDADADLLLSPTQNTVLYQKITSSGGLPLFLKRTSTADQPHTLEIRFVSKYEANKETTVAAVNLLPVAVAVDYNRDGMINGEDSGMASVDKPFVFWINDDDDENEEPHFGDIPGQGIDNADDLVNGERDLVDFFPVRLRIEKLLEALPPAKYSYRVSHPTGALNFIEMPNILPDSQRINGAGSYLVDEFKANEVMARPLKDTAGNGSELSAEYLEAVKNGMGVLLFESKAATNQSFELIVLKRSDNSEMARIPSEVWMNFVPVEDMFWYVNIRQVVNSNFTPPVIKDAQNERFRESRKSRWFVFCHGYNVSDEAARGWNAEIFKRLHQMGSNSKFLGVSWEGNQGQISEKIPFLGGKTPDYWQNVDNAFRSSSALSSLVNGLDGVKVIAGHSLGNMLVSSAICDHRLGSEHYFMLNAAVAREAYSATHVTTDRNQVRNERWKDYATKLWPTDYWNLGFTATDGRKNLTWQGRFSTLEANTSPHNYHSTGEDVLKNGDSTTPGLLADVIFRGEYAWIKQEMGKGEATKAFATRTTNGNWVSSGGWAFNWQVYPDYQPNPLDPPDSHEDSNSLVNAQLRVDPFFTPFRTFGGQSIHGADGSALAADYNNRSYLLGHDLPAISNPAGSNAISFNDNAPKLEMNSDMPTKLKSGNWGNWKHSDLKDEPIDHVWKLFSDMVTKGDLND